MARKKSGGGLGSLVKVALVLVVGAIGAGVMLGKGVNPLDAVKSFLDDGPGGASETAVVESCVEAHVEKSRTAVLRHSQKSRFQPTPTGHSVLIDYETDAGPARMKCYLGRDDAVEKVIEAPLDERILQ